MKRAVSYKLIDDCYYINRLI